MRVFQHYAYGMGFVTALAALGCYSPTRKLTLRVELPAELVSDAKALEVLPHIAEIRRELGNGVVALELKRDARKVRLVLPGACPASVDLPAEGAASPREVRLKPLFKLGPSERVVGLAQAIVVQAAGNCPEAEPARTTFTLTAGAPLEDVKVDASGRTFTARTRSVPPPTRAENGVIAVSAHEQQKLRSEVTFQAKLPNGVVFRRVLGIAAVARSSGLSDVGLTHPVLISGSGWSLQKKPEGSQAQLRPVQQLFELEPDLPGSYELLNDVGRTLSLHSARYDQTPLDCGRANCHADIAKSAAQSPMTQVLASDLGGCHSLTDPACASACHATGEPGTSDGGFTHVAHELGLAGLPSEHDDLPRALRRLGGVGCMACHGPSKIPEQSERFSILRSDVCAVCHDAPPRYGHVQALASSRMAHADHAPEMRQNSACARCHTSWGAIGRPAPPPDTAESGITCATCHDVHPHGPGQVDAAASPSNATAVESLLRYVALPSTLPHPPASFLGKSRVCIACHAPSSSMLRPEASAAAIVAGQGGLEPSSGGALELSAPHASNPRGCLSCHSSGPEGLVLGQNHGFRATVQACKTCHETVPGRDPAIAQRAQQLLARLDPQHSRGSADKPWHANYELLLPTPQATRALRDVLLVLEDPAADVHQPAYANALLDASERIYKLDKP
jgi:hypothetical protein